jgi:hypothetical protein
MVPTTSVIGLLPGSFLDQHELPAASSSLNSIVEHAACHPY